ncbi:MAG: ABC transporter permease, partial [Mycobacterium sp.]|nr:ABC transporter permease [Mycobacterium sp.]
MAGSTAVATPYARFPRAVATLSAYSEAPARQLTEIGRMIWFALTAVGLIPFALQRYRTELLRMVAQMGMGTGAMAVAGGTAAIVGFITMSAGSLVAIQGFASLGNI